VSNGRPAVEQGAGGGAAQCGGTAWHGPKLEAKTPSKAPRLPTRARSSCGRRRRRAPCGRRGAPWGRAWAGASAAGGASRPHRLRRVRARGKRSELQQGASHRRGAGRPSPARPPAPWDLLTGAPSTPPPQTRAHRAQRGTCPSRRACARGCRSQPPEAGGGGRRLGTPQLASREGRQRSAPDRQIWGRAPSRPPTPVPHLVAVHHELVAVRQGRALLGRLRGGAREEVSCGRPLPGTVPPVKPPAGRDDESGNADPRVAVANGHAYAGGQRFGPKAHLLLEGRAQPLGRGWGVGRKAQITHRGLAG
jgi:hypothetical protein